MRTVKCWGVIHRWIQALAVQGTKNDGLRRTFTLAAASPGGFRSEAILGAVAVAVVEYYLAMVKRRESARAAAKARRWPSVS